jgi:hypothetical protein
MSTPYVLLVIENSAFYERSFEQKYSELIAQTSKEGIEVIQKNSLLLCLPEKLPLLANLSALLQRNEFSYSTAFFNEKPIFQTHT